MTPLDTKVSWKVAFKVVSEVGDWARDDIAVQTSKGTMSTKVVLDIASTGAHYELEATTIMGGFDNIEKALLNAYDVVVLDRDLPRIHGAAADSAALSDHLHSYLSSRHR